MEKVYVAMSGGVDSSVAAALLKKRGFEVVGVFFKPWSPSSTDYCNWREDREIASRAASKLKIEFKTWDFSREYKNKVVDYMVESYRNNLTPNPDVMCNKEIKFGLFLEKSLSEGADLIATGHYVRIEKLKSKNEKLNSFKLLKGVDMNKDQSYFLWTLTQRQLKYCRFPIGVFTKPEVRHLAKKFGLPNHDKKDSQGICFIGQIDIKNFLKNNIRPVRGEVIDIDTNKNIGVHDGVYYYTIGQRHGLDLKDGGGPYYIYRKDPKKNIIYVSKYLPKLNSNTATLKKTNWIAKKPVFPLKADVMIRYRSKSIASVIGKRDRKITVNFLEPARAATPGQSAVIYQGGVMLGGGIIE